MRRLRGPVHVPGHCPQRGRPSRQRRQRPGVGPRRRAPGDRQDRLVGQRSPAAAPDAGGPPGRWSEGGGVRGAEARWSGADRGPGAGLQRRRLLAAERAGAGSQLPDLRAGGGAGKVLRHHAGADQRPDRRGHGHQPRALRDLRGRGGRREDVAGGGDAAYAAGVAGPGAGAVRDSHQPARRAREAGRQAWWARRRSTPTSPPASTTCSSSTTGYTPLERTITATSGVDETLDLDLVRVPTSFPFGVAGWAAIGAGVAMAGGGMYFLSKDGDEVSCTMESQMDQRGRTAPRCTTPSCSAPRCWG